MDIEPNGFNVAPETIAQHLDEEVGGIVLTHCFGMPLDVERLDALAAEAGVPIMYDAAHAFGSTVNGKSIFAYGDISTCSFHATKIFHSVEGGAIFARHPDTIKQSALLRNFGHSGYEDFAAVGINGKNSEMHAAMGVVNLAYIDDLLEERKGQTETYTRLLAAERSLTIPEWETPGWNHAFYPVLFENEESTVKVMEFLNGFGIYPRRYFYPSLHTVNGWEGDCPNSTDVASRVLCLPLYHGLTTREQANDRPLHAAQLTPRLSPRTSRSITMPRGNPTPQFPLPPSSAPRARSTKKASDSITGFHSFHAERPRFELGDQDTRSQLSRLLHYHSATSPGARRGR